MGPRARNIADVMTAIGVVAAIMILVRPGSRGPALVKGLGDAFAAAAQGTIGATLTGQQPLAPNAPKRGGSSSGGSDSGGSGFDPLAPLGNLPITPWGGGFGGGPITGIPFSPINYNPRQFDTPSSTRAVPTSRLT